MEGKKISYLNRNFEDYRDALKEYISKYYPQIANDFDDASIGSWLIDIVASVADNLSFHIDRVYGETDINTAQQISSIYNIARSNGLKVPGPKGSIVEVEFTCELPLSTEYNNSSSTVGVPNWHFAPKIKRGTKLSYRNQYFEVMDDIDFAEQFNNNGVSNRTIEPVRNANGDIVSYLVKKVDVVVGGESKIYKQVVNSVHPFMEIVLPDTDVMEIDSILFKVGGDYNSNPSFSEFMVQKEYVPANENNNVETYRFFEVNSLLDQYVWGDDISNNVEGNQSAVPSKKYEYGYYDQINDTYVPTASVTKGRWVPLTQKFITEYTDNGYMKIIFGSGESVGQNIPKTAMDFSQAMMSRMVQNNFLGKLPPSTESTMYVLYRVGGGATSNVPKGAMTNISYLNAEIGRCIRTTDDQNMAAAVKNSITVKNTTPSVSGKDSPSVDEIRMMIKYNNASQERCITTKDYETRIMMMPSRYGCPFRVSAVEENNKIMLYLLGIDYLGKLTSEIPTVMIENITNYLSMYKSINDYVEMKSARIVNLSFQADIFVNKNYNYGDVMNNVIEVIKSYMDINKHYLGEDIFVGDLEKEIGNVDGVINVIELRVYNEFGENYSKDRATQATVGITSELTDEYGYAMNPDETENRAQIDLAASDYVLNSNADTMFEIKYPENDIIISIKSR